LALRRRVHGLLPVFGIFMMRWDTDLAVMSFGAAFAAMLVVFLFLELVR
jgi:hypothetical protein